MFVCWRASERSVAELEAQLMALAPRLLEHPCERLVLNPSDGPPSPIERPRADGSVIAATVTATLPSDRVAEEFAELLSEPCAFVAGYAVTVALPLDYERS